MNTEIKSKAPFLNAVCKSKSMHMDADHYLAVALKAQGWKYTCDTPDCCWHWEKTLPDGRVIICSKEKAANIETSLCGETFGDVDE